MGQSSGVPDGPRILFLDIETAPMISYTWGLYDQTVGINQIKQRSYVLCWAAKWVGQRNVISDALINYPKDYAKDPTNDRNIAVSARNLLNEADIVVTHNGDSFDIKWLNTLFLKHRLGPASKFHSIDTCKVSKYKFKFCSNKLENVLKEMSLHSKLSHEGFGLWEKCMRGEKKAWATMVKYCKQDVKILEPLYYEYRPYIKTHPRMRVFKPAHGKQCPACGSNNVIGGGYSYTQTGKFQRYECRGCGKWSTDRRNLLSKVKPEEDLRGE